MGLRRVRLVLTALLALATVPVPALAGQEGPTYVWSGAAPSGACSLNRVVIVVSTGRGYCCQGGFWAECLDADLLDAVQGAHYLSPALTSTLISDCNVPTYGYRYWEPASTNCPTSGAGWGTLLTWPAYGTSVTPTSGVWVFQAGWDTSGTGSGPVGYVRSNINGAGWSGWKKIWHSGNDGAGSGLDADTVDGVAATDDRLLIGDGVSWAGSTLPAVDCTNSQKLQYTNATNSWSCPGGITAAGVPALAFLPTLPDANYPAGAMVYLTTDKKLYRSDGSNWIKATDGADITARTIGAGSLVADSITAGEISASAIGASELAAGAVTAEKISANVISVSQLVQNYGDNLFPNGTSETAPPSGAPQSVLDSAEFAYRSASAGRGSAYGRRFTTAASVCAENGAAPLEEFVLAAYARYVTSGSGTLEIGCWNGSSWDSETTDGILSSTFSLYLLKRFCPSTTTKVRFCIAGASGTVDFDQINAWRQIKNIQIPDDEIGSVQINDGAGSPQVVAAGGLSTTSSSVYTPACTVQMTPASGVNNGQTVWGKLITESSSSTNGFKLRFVLDSTDMDGTCRLRSEDAAGTLQDNIYVPSTTGDGISNLSHRGTVPSIWTFECALTSTVTSPANTKLYVEFASENSGTAVYVRSGSYCASGYPH